MEKMYRLLNQYALDALEALDLRDTFTKRLGYKFARKIFDISFVELNGYSPYDIGRLEEW